MAAAVMALVTVVGMATVAESQAAAAMEAVGRAEGAMGRAVVHSVVLAAKVVRAAVARTEKHRQRRAGCGHTWPTAVCGCTRR